MNPFSLPEGVPDFAHTLTPILSQRCIPIETETFIKLLEITGILALNLATSDALSRIGHSKSIWSGKLVPQLQAKINETEEYEAAVDRMGIAAGFSPRKNSGLRETAGQRVFNLLPIHAIIRTRVTLATQLRV
jgi:hypothetical protein